MLSPLGEVGDGCNEALIVSVNFKWWSQLEMELEEESEKGKESVTFGMVGGRCSSVDWIVTHD